MLPASSIVAAPPGNGSNHSDLPGAIDEILHALRASVCGWSNGMGNLESSRQGLGSWMLERGGCPSGRTRAASPRRRVEVQDRPGLCELVDRLGTVRSRRVLGRDAIRRDAFRLQGGLRVGALDRGECDATASASTGWPARRSHGRAGDARRRDAVRRMTAAGCSPPRVEGRLGSVFAGIERLPAARDS
jgi:hypothetical protein